MEQRWYQFLQLWCLLASLFIFKAKYFRKFCCLDALFSTVQNWSGGVTDIGWLQKTGFGEHEVSVERLGQWLPISGHADAQWPCPKRMVGIAEASVENPWASQTNLCVKVCQIHYNMEPKHRGCRPIHGWFMEDILANLSWKNKEPQACRGLLV